MSKTEKKELKNWIATIGLTACLAGLIYGISISPQPYTEPDTEQNTIQKEVLIEQIVMATPVPMPENKTQEDADMLPVAIPKISELPDYISEEPQMETYHEPQIYYPEEKEVYYEEEIVYYTEPDYDYIYDQDTEEVYEPDGEIDDSGSDTEYTDILYDTGTSSNPYGLSDDEIHEIARITWLEVGICEYYTQYLTACVLINRYLNWYGPGATIYDVVYEDYGGMYVQYATRYQYVDWGGSSLNISQTTWNAVYDALYNLDPYPYYQCSWTNAHTLYYVDYGPANPVCFYLDD